VNSDELTKVLVGAQLTLLDDESIEDFGFCPNGKVVATLGSRNQAVCFPVLKYRVTEDGKVYKHDQNSRSSR